MISATFCAIIPLAPVVQVLPLERRSDRTSVFETGLTRARHEPAIGATKSTRLVGLRRSLARLKSEFAHRIFSPKSPMSGAGFAGHSRAVVQTGACACILVRSGSGPCREAKPPQPPP